MMGHLLQHPGARSFLGVHGLLEAPIDSPIKEKDALVVFFLMD